MDVQAVVSEQSWSDLLVKAGSDAISVIQDNEWALLWLVVVGCFVGCCTMFAVRWWYGDMDAAPLDIRAAHDTFLRRCALISGFGWTLLATTIYMVAKITPAIAVAVGICGGLAMIAAAGTPVMDRLLIWIVTRLVPAFGRWLLAKVRALFGAGDQPPEEK